MLTWRRKLVDVGLLVLVNAMWAGQYAAYKTATDAMGPITVSVITFLFATIALIPFLLHERRRSSAQDHLASQSKASLSFPRREGWSRQDITGFIVVGVLGLMPASAFLAWGTMRSTASNAALIYLTIPILTALLAAMILGEKMTGARWLSIVVALCGVLILSDIDWRRLNLASGRYLFANVLILLACLSSSFYNVYSKRLLRRFTPLEVLVFGYSIAVVISLPLLIWVEPLTMAQIRGYTAATWFSVMILSVFSWGIAMVLWMFLLKRLDVSQASVSVYLLPFLGVLIASLTLGERITLTMLIGGLMTLAGTILVTMSEASPA
ncbi:MAG: DMT family transporter [Acidobacteriia bacterium]|nr:DMT family transporter [Terriglobia bacterium]